MDIKDKIGLGFNLLFAFGGSLFAIIAWNSWSDTCIKTQGMVLGNVRRLSRIAA